MRRLLIAALIAACVPVAAHAAHFPADSAVAAILRSRVDAERAVGIVVGLVEDGRTRVIAQGRSSAAPGARPLDGRTVFEIGSVTKVFTATLLAEMARRGEVRLDQPVAELAPEMKVPEKDGRKITLTDLATHRSGLPRMPGNFAPANSTNPYADYTAEKMAAFLGGYTLPRAIGERFEYSNLGAGLLGHALAQRAKQSYEAAMIERVLKPLGMDDTRITLTADMKSRLATGHDGALAPVPNWDVAGATSGAGALRSTANDMLAFLAAQLDSTALPISPALRETQRIRGKTTNDAVSIGLGWHVFTRDNEIFWHNGRTGGYHTFAAFDPKRRIGVVVLCNTGFVVDDIGRHLMDPSVPLATYTKHTQVPIDAKLLADYVGKYALSPMFVIDVTREGDQLFIQATGQSRLPVYPESDTRFFLKVVEAQVSFERDAAGKVVALTLHQGGRDQRAGRVN